MNSGQKKQPPAPTRVSAWILARAKPTIPQVTQSNALMVNSTVVVAAARRGFSGGGTTAAATTTTVSKKIFKY